MNPSSFCDENVYEKWLRRRLNYATLRAIGSHAPPAFVHSLAHHGSTKDDVFDKLKRKVWLTPSLRGASRGVALFQWPQPICDIMDFRFLEHPEEKYCMGYGGKLALKKDCDSNSAFRNAGYMGTFRPSIQELLNEPSWYKTSDMEFCKYPHQHETPLSWTLNE